MRITRITLTALAALAVVAALTLGFMGNQTGMLITGIGATWLVVAAAMAWDLGIGVIVAMIAGMGASLYLANQHIAVDAGAISICSVSETFDCDKVNTSDYSELFGIPVALYGLGFYFAAAYAAFMRRLGRGKLAGLPRVLVVAGVGSVCYSALLAWVSHTMGTWCLFCISMYGINLALLVAGLLALRKPALLLPAQNAPSSPFVHSLLGLGGDRTVPVMAVAGLVCFGLSLAVYNGKKGQLAGGGGASATDPAVLASYYHLPKGDTVQLTGDEPIYGKASAPYLIVEWADYGCPYCARAGEGVKELVRDNPAVQVRFKHYPLSDTCNPHVSADLHPTACEASKATECARQQGRFWELSDLVFDNQRYQSSEDIRFMAKQAELDMEALEACIASPITDQRIKADADHANAVELTGTPTFFMRGLFGEQWVQVRSKPEAMQALVEAHAAGIELHAPGPAPEPER